MCKKIKYEDINEYECITPCPYGKGCPLSIYYVGSYGCIVECGNCISVDRENKTITCKMQAEQGE